MPLSIGDPLADEGWDERLLAHGGGGFFHSAAWARVLSEVYGYRPFYLAETSGGRLGALLPLMEVRSLFTGNRGVSLPFSDYCEPLLPPGYPAEELLEALGAIGRRRAWRFIDIRGGGDLFRGAPPAATYYVQDIDLASSGTGLLGAMNESTRRNIRKARREDVQVSIESSGDAVAAFYRLNCLTRREHGLPPQPKAFFRSIHRHVLEPGRGFIALATVAGRPAAGAMFVHFGRHALYKYGASDARFLSLRPNHLVLYEAMLRCREEGFSELCLGRTDVHHEGLRRYKAGFGARERSLTYYRYLPRRGTFAQGGKPSGRLSAGLFRRLPLPLSRLIGRIAYRHVA